MPTDEVDLVEHCRRELAAFKVPVRVRLVAELPTVGIGKIDRARVHDLVADVVPDRTDGGMP